MYAAQTAQQMVEVARSSMQQTAESLRILRDRYTAGLATMTDLLRAEDADRQSAAGYWQAVSRLRMARADLLYAMGSLNPETVEELQ